MSLTDELCEAILILALRHFSPVLDSYDDVPRCVGAYLNTQLRGAVPAVSHAALMRLTWIDLDIAFRIGDTWLLDTMRAMHPLRRPLQYSHNLFTTLAKAGRLHVFDWWCKTWTAGPRGQPIIYAETDQIMDVASEFGHVHVLEWCFKQDREMKFEYSERAMNKASGNGFVNVLDWWLEEHRQNARELKYTAAAIDSASAAGHLSVLEWWKNKSGLPLKFTAHMAFPQTVSKAHLPVFVWWKYSGLCVIPNLSKITESAIRSKRMDLLRWVSDTGYLQVEDHHVAISCSVTNIELPIVKFVCQHVPTEAKTEFNASQAFINASEAGRGDLLDFLETSGLNWVDGAIHQAVLAAARNGCLLVLDWWAARTSEWHAETVTSMLLDATGAGRVSTLEWIYSKGLVKDETFSQNSLWVGALDNAFHARSLGALNWWAHLFASSQFVNTGTLSQDKLQDKYSELIKHALAQGWTDYIVWAHSQGHVLKLDASCVILAKKGTSAFETCLRLYYNSLVAGPSTDWAALGISNPIQWANHGIQMASERGNVQALDFYHRCSIPAPEGGYSGLVRASQMGLNQVLRWWLDKGLPLAQFDAIAPCQAVTSNPFVFDFWSRHKDQLPFSVSSPRVTASYSLSMSPMSSIVPSPVALAAAIHTKLVPSASPSLALELSTAAPMKSASCLEWWFAYCGRPASWTQFSREALQDATRYDLLPILDWWKLSGIKLEVPFRHIGQVRGSYKAIEWWRKSGLVQL